MESKTKVIEKTKRKATGRLNNGRKKAKKVSHANGNESIYGLGPISKPNLEHMRRCLRRGDITRLCLRYKVSKATAYKVLNGESKNFEFAAILYEQAIENAQKLKLLNDKLNTITFTNPVTQWPHKTKKFNSFHKGETHKRKTLNFA